MKRILFLIVLLLFSVTMFSQTKQRESYYQKEFAKAIDGEIEYVLEDRTRVDVLTDEYTIEVDFAYKWAESIGQSLHYAKMLDKKAGVLLVVNGDEDHRFVMRLMGVAIKYNITVWIWDYSDDTWGRLEPETTYVLVKNKFK